MLPLPRTDWVRALELILSPGAGNPRHANDYIYLNVNSWFFSAPLSKFLATRLIKYCLVFNFVHGYFILAYLYVKAC